MTDQESRSGGGGHARLAIIAAALVVILGSSGVAWFAYNKGFYRASDQLAPLVQAQSGATKRRPEQPGGLEIRHQDKLVFERLAPGENRPRVEHLLPPPEEPLAKPEPPVQPEQVAEAESPAKPEPTVTEVAEQTTETQAPPEIAGNIIEALTNRTPASPVVPEQSAEATPTTESLLAEAPSPPPLPPTEPAKATVKPVPESLLAAVSPPPPAPEPQIAAKPDPAPEITPAATLSGAWRVQLASLSSDKGVRAEWQRIQGRNEELLKNLQLNVQEATLSRGTFYRIQAGPLADRAAAQQLCASLKQRRQDCLVVKP